MLQNDSEFTRVLRGYDVTEVNRTIHKLRRELLALKTDHDEQVLAISALTAQLEKIQTDAEQIGRPTFSGLGARLASTLSIAEEQATRLVARAEADAHNILVAANREADQVRVGANDDARRIRESADTAAGEALSDAQNRARLLLAEAEHDADVLRSDAEDAARAIRGASATEIANTRTSAKRELEQLQAENQRQLAEARLVLVAKRAEGVDVSEELMNILKIEADRTASIDETETALLARHQEAVAQTQKYIDEAQAQAAVTRTGALERERAALALEQEAIAEAHAAREDAAEHVAKLSAEAEARAAALVSDAEKRSSAMLTEAESTVADLRVEREAVAQYFEGLRLVLGQATDVMSETGENPHLNS
ncbi:MAG: DivIVA domain-containing protein [Actinomycetales bacterium]|nr:DivIVA domain-containing protein [Actinomycetales bacterium]